MYRSSSSHYDDSMNDNWMHRDVSSLHCYDRNRYEPHRFEHHPIQGPSSLMRDNMGPYHTESWRRAPYGAPDMRYQDCNSPIARHHPYDYYSGDPRYHQDYNQSPFLPRDHPPNGNQYPPHRPPHNYALNTRAQEPNQFQRRFKDDDRFNRNRKFDTRRNFKNRKTKPPKKDERERATSSSTDFEQDNIKINTSKDLNQHGASVSSTQSISSESALIMSATEANLDGYGNKYIEESLGNPTDNGNKKEENQEKAGMIHNNCDIQANQDTNAKLNVNLDISMKEIETSDIKDFKDDTSLNGSDISGLDDDWKEIIDLVDGKIKPSDIINSGNRLSSDNRDMYRTY